MMISPEPVPSRLRPRRLVLAYVVMAGVLAAVFIVVFHAGSSRHARPAVAGTYRVTAPSPCIGPPRTTFTLDQSGEFISLDGPGSVDAKLRYRGSTMTGSLTCSNGRAVASRIQVLGTGSGKVTLRATAPLLAATLLPAEVAAAAPAITRSPEDTFGRLMLATAAVILAARLVGGALRRIGQPQVMGEVLAGILLGPTLLGAVLPDVQNYLFPADIIPLLRAGADIGLAFYMFLVGLEVDPRLLRGRVAQAALVSNASVALPMALGVAVALPLYTLVGPSGKDFAPFALFVGVAMSITAFPVLARILVERRMLKRPVGALALGAAAVDDVTAWGLLALATAIAGEGSGLHALAVIGYVILFCVGMAFAVRPILGRVSTAYDEAGYVPAGWIGVIFVGVLAAAYGTSQIGIASIFGAFVMGLIMPRRADLSADVTRRVESFVVTVLLPLFFVVTGLKTQVGLLDRPILWVIAVILLAIAIVGKWFGAMAASRYAGASMRESSVLGALMNARGLTELIVLNIGLDLGVITPAMFAMLVLMALITTFMTAPALRAIDPRRIFSAPVEDELREVAEPTPAAPPAPAHSILVAPQEERNIDRLLGLAEPLAQSQPPRDLILVGLVRPARISTGVRTDDRELARVSGELDRRRRELLAAGFAVRTAAFTSADPGGDLVRLAGEREVDLLLLDGRRPLLGEGVPRGAIGTVLEHAVCDVAVLVERVTTTPEIGPDHPVVVPFGGAAHDWAALELGAWIATVHGARLLLLGVEADPESGERDASRLLANASLVVQQLAGIAAEPLLVERGREGVLRAAEDAGLLAIGLSERWRSEGLGPARSAIARAAPAPVIFVRRGLRPGALAPADNMTRFTWSAGGDLPA